MHETGPTKNSSSSTDPAAGEPVSAPALDTRWFKRELTPTWIRTACLLGGNRPPDLVGSFRSLYLGDRPNLTPAVVAAVHPAAEVAWWSPNAVAVELARRWRDAANLTNLKVHEKPVPPFDATEPLDLLVVDGVIDSVSATDRTILVEALGSLVRPGGLLCVSYRTTVGWGELVPVHRLLRHLIANHGGTEDQALGAARSTLSQLREGGAGYLTRPVVRSWVDEVLSGSSTVRLRPWLEHQLSPLSHAQLAEALHPAGLDHIGDAALTVDEADLKPQLANIVDGAPNSVLRETLDDLARRRTHRIDLFRLGSGPMGGRDQRRAVEELELLPGESWSTVDDDVVAPSHDGPISVLDLATGADDRVELVSRLMRSGQAHPINADAVAPVVSSTAARLEAAMRATPVTAAERVLVAPAIGSAVRSTRRPTRPLRTSWGMA